jgi:ATP:corrinoid adenosyltransferase
LVNLTHGFFLVSIWWGEKRGKEKDKGKSTTAFGQVFSQMAVVFRTIIFISSPII